LGSGFAAAAAAAAAGRGGAHWKGRSRESFF
jgi:hypothetical protein